MAGRCSRHVLSIGVAILAAAALAAAQPPSSASAARPQSAAQRAAERIRALQRESDALASREKTLLVELRALEVQRELKTEQLASVERELRETRETLTGTIMRAAALRETAREQQPDVDARLVQLYKLGRAGYWKLLLDFDNVRAIGRAYRTASAMQQMDRDHVQQHQRTLEALAREQQVLEKRVADIERLQDQAARAKAAVERAVTARTALVTSIDAHRDLNAQLAGELEAAQQRLQGTVGQLGASRSLANALPIRPFRGALSWPASGIVTKRFGKQSISRSGPSMSRTGIEISVAEGEPVRSVHEGVVAYADPFTGYGNLVIVDHGDGAYSLYGYLASVEVSRGDRIAVQAALGRSGRNPGGNPALYFELRVDGAPVDPLQWLKKQR